MTATLRNLAALVMIWTCLAGGPRAARAAAKKPPARPLPALAEAKWIWDAKTAAGEGVFACYFRKVLDLPAKPAWATALVTADNGYELYVNGSVVGGETGYESAYWQSVEKYDIAHLLAAGRNVIAIRGTNLGGPAGLLAAVRVGFEARQPIDLFTDGTWRQTVESQTGWTHKDYDASSWPRSAELGPVGVRPWGKVTYPGPPSPTRGRRRASQTFTQPGEDFRWPEAVVFLTGRVPESSTRLPQCVWRIAGSRAYLEMDKLGPSVLGRRLHVLQPARPDGTERVLLDAGGGVVGSPSVSWDGRWVYLAMAPAGEKFFSVFRVPAGGGQSQRLTRGAFHDFDPAELPDGRIVFSSTRIGSREEYHGNAARSLFVMDADGSNIRPLTVHIVGDNEPRVTAGGLVAFIRCDNFLERAKVETQLHMVHPDGTAGVVLMGADRYAIGYGRAAGAEGDARWLRRYGYGSPAPLPDGRVACLSHHGLVISAGGTDPPIRVAAQMGLFDISPLPDGRLLCTVAGQGAVGVLDLASGEVVRLYARDTYDLHSPVYLGPRPRPPILSPVLAEADGADRRTGYLLCQNVFHTKQTAADLSRVRAIRVYEGRPLTNRSARHSYNHIGVEAVELGTAPLAPDGSFYVEVPADRALALQAVDAEGRSVINELSWIYVRPGERRSCVGCHSPRQAAPPPQRGVFAAAPRPIKLLGRGRPHRFRGNNAANGGVLNLQLDRFREAAAINLYSLGAPSAAKAGPAGPTGREGDIREAVGRLRAGDEAARLSAARRLAILRSRTATEAVCAALRDDSEDVRIAAALALSACGDRRAIAPLLAALSDASAHVAQAAHVALENLTGHAEPFDGYGQPAARRRGASAWRRWRQATAWDRVEADLIARVGGDEPAARHAAIVALGHVGGEPARAALRAWLVADKGDDLRGSLAAARALGHLRDRRAVALLAGLLDAGARGATKRGKGFHELGWWQAPTHRAAAAAEALGLIGTAEAEAALIDAYARLGDFWQYSYRTGDHDWLMGCHASVIHYRILEALDAIGTSAAGRIAPAILKAVPIDTDRGLLFENDSYEVVTSRVIGRCGVAAEAVATCLAVLGDGASRPAGALRAAVTASPPARSVGPLRAESRAAQILSVICRDARHGPRVRQAFQRYRAGKPSRKRSWVCFFLARTLGKLRDAGSVDVLSAALSADATEGSFGRPDPPNVFLHNAMTPCYRAAAADALGRIGRKQAVGALLAAVGDFDNAVEVRHAAARALAMIADPARLAEMERLARAYPEVVTRRELLRACERASARTPGR